MCDLVLKPTGLPPVRWRDFLRLHWPTWLLWVAFVAVLGAHDIVAAWFVGLVPLGRAGDAVLITWPLLYFAILLSLFSCGGILAAGRDRRHLVRRRITARLCPACAYPIGGLSPQGDGLVVCPECGAAWRIPPETTPRV